MITFSALQTYQIDIITAMMKDFYAIDNYPIDVATSKRLFQEFITNENLGKAWLIYNDNEVVGYLILTFVFSFEYKGKIVFLDELYINASQRGKGIGKKAIQFIKEQATFYNYKIIYLEVENHNENAQKLYLSNGFETHNRKILKHAIEKL